MELPAIYHKTFIKAPVAKVYEAISTSAGWNSWFTDRSIVDLKKKQILLKWVDFGPDHLSTQDGGPIVEAVSGKKFSFKWNPGKNQTLVTFTLRKQKAGTILEVSDRGWKEGDYQAYMGCAVGWGEALTLLKYYLEWGRKAEFG